MRLVFSIVDVTAVGSALQAPGKCQAWLIDWAMASVGGDCWLVGMPNKLHPF